MLEFTVEDLFVAGLAIDFVGASLLAKSLFKTPQAIAARAAEHATFDPAVAVQLAEDKIDGNFGLTYLLSGFTLQAIGYEILLSTDQAGNERGFEVAVTALVVAAFCAVPLYALWRSLRGRLMRWQVRKVAAITRMDEDIEADGVPSLQVLLACAKEIGAQRAAGSSEESFVGEVFGAKAVFDEASEPITDPELSA